MSDNEIIKDSDCLGKFVRGALDLINRKDAEIERLKEELDGETVKNMRLGHEIEQWEEEANRYQNLWCEAMKDIQTAKFEAIKEFAERIKNECESGWLEISEIDFDNLVKEMAGE